MNVYCACSYSRRLTSTLIDRQRRQTPKNSLFVLLFLHIGTKTLKTEADLLEVLQQNERFFFCMQYREKAFEIKPEN